MEPLTTTYLCLPKMSKGCLLPCQNAAYLLSPEAFYLPAEMQHTYPTQRRLPKGNLTLTPKDRLPIMPDGSRPLLSKAGDLVFPMPPIPPTQRQPTLLATRQPANPADLHPLQPPPQPTHKALDIGKHHQNKEKRTQRIRKTTKKSPQQALM